MAKSNVYNMDCMELMHTLPDKCFVLSIADPPYQLKKDGEPWAYTIGLVTDWYIKWICKERRLLTFVPVDMVKPEYLEQINYKEDE